MKDYSLFYLNASAVSDHSTQVEDDTNCQDSVKGDNYILKEMTAQ